MALGDWRIATSDPPWWVDPLVEGGTTFQHAGPVTKQVVAWWDAISASRGIDASQMSRIGQFLEQGGFSSVQTKTETLSVGAWGGRLGNLFAQDIWQSGQA